MGNRESFLKTKQKKTKIFPQCHSSSPGPERSQLLLQRKQKWGDQSMGFTHALKVVFSVAQSSNHKLVRTPTINRSVIMEYVGCIYPMPRIYLYNRTSPLQISLEPSKSAPEGGGALQSRFWGHTRRGKERGKPVV